MKKRYIFLAGVCILLLAGCNIPGFKNKTNSNSKNGEEEAIDETGSEAIDDVDANAAVEDANTTIEEELNPALKMSAEEKKAAEIRDKQRLADIKQIQDALEKYYKDNKDSYPQEIESLVPKYLKALPKNPAPGGEDYSYTPIGSEPSKYYDLVYTLEVGVDGEEWGQQAVSPEVAEEVESEASEE